MSSSFKRRNRKPPTTSNTPSPPSTTPSFILPGCKPSTGNTITTSFGLREIDSFFFSSSGASSTGASGGGGGQPLQSLVLVEEDRLSNDLAWCLGRYWCAQGVAGGQTVLMGAFLESVGNRLNGLMSLNDLESACSHEGYNDGCTAEELEEFRMSLPRNLHLDKFRSREKVEQTAGASVEKAREPISIIEEQDEDADEQDGQTANSSDHYSRHDEGLVNAWQYRKSVQDARSGMGTKSSEISTAGNVYCHSFDLSKRMWDQFANQGDSPLLTHVKIVDCSCKVNTHDHRMQGMHLFQSIWNHIQSILSNNSQTAIRLFLRRLPIAPGTVALPLLMAKIRQNNLPIVILATIRPWRFLSSSNTVINKFDTISSLRNTSDTIFTLDSFSSYTTPPPPEFSLLQGILTIRKCASFTTSYYTDTICFKNRPLAERFGIKRDGRKVTVELLHLPPEEYSRGGGSTEGVRSGAGQVQGVGSGGGCSSNLGGSSSDW